MLVSSVNTKIFAGTTSKGIAKSHVADFKNQNSTSDFMSVSKNYALSQMPNVHFKAGRYQNLSSYYNYTGPRPSDIEIEKFQISSQAEEYVRNHDYLNAIKSKLSLASICKKQGNERDAFLLEQGIRRYYGLLPVYESYKAKEMIREYNSEMADFIDEDIKNIEY